jgi:hypothetical protein
MMDKFDADLGDILARRHLHDAEKRNAAESRDAAAKAAAKAFNTAWAECKAIKIFPVLEQALKKLKSEGFEAEISDGGGPQGDSKFAITSPGLDARVGKKVEGIGVPVNSPYLTFQPRAVEGVIHIAQSLSGGSARGAGDLKIEELTPDTVKVKVIDFVRAVIEPPNSQGGMPV